MYFLSIDIGTSAVKLSVVDETGKTKCHAKQEYNYIILPGEKIELSPVDLFHAIKTAARKLDAHALSKVELLCYDTFSPSLVLMDDKGDLVYPNIITHLDRRSRKESLEIQSTIGSENYMHISGIYPFVGGCSAMTLLWIKKNIPDILDKIFKVGHLTTYIHKKLTGLWITDLVNASMLGLYDTTTQKGWSDTLISPLKLNSAWFTDIYNPGFLYGTLLPQAAEILGIPEGIPVAIGTNDVAAAQMGAQNNKPGQIMNTAGSSEMVSILTDKPVCSSDYYLRNAALPGLWQIYATTAGGFAVDWFYKEFCKEMPRKEFYEEYLIHSLEEYSSSNETTFDPYLTGDRQSLVVKTGSWHGLTLSTTREAMLASMLKSMQQVLYSTIKKAEDILPLDSTIKISGGMVTPSYLKLKEEEMPGYTFKQVDDCPILGNIELVKYHNYQKL